MNGNDTRKKALKELLGGVGALAAGIVAWLVSRLDNFEFVEGVTTRYEARSHIYLVAAAWGAIIVGAIVIITGLVHLAKSGKGGKGPTENQ